MPRGPPWHGTPPGHLTLVQWYRALPAEGGSLRGRPSGGKWTRWCTVNSWTSLVVLRSVVLLRGRMVCCMVGNWPLRHCCHLLGCCYMMGCVASIVVTSTMVLCVMLSVMFPMVAVMAMVASGAIWGCKGSSNN